MANWSFPHLSVGDDGSFAVGVDIVDSVSVDMTHVDSPEFVDEVQYVNQDSVVLTVSGNDVQHITMSPEVFQEMFSSLPDTVSDNDIVDQVLVDSDDIMPLDVSSSSFNPQQWQINVAQNRPIGHHYIMSRGSGSNDYYVIVGEDITYSGGIYRYVDSTYYRIYSFVSGSTTRYDYSVQGSVSGSVSSGSYVIYSDLYFDFFGGRSFQYSWFILAFIVIFLLVLLWFKSGGTQNG